jgi:hypothetical protein
MPLCQRLRLLYTTTVRLLTARRLGDPCLSNHHQLTLSPWVCLQATMTPAERLWQARREKEKGNEMFKAKEYPNAINAYSLSLKLSPGVAAVHTNRAAAYLKVKRCVSPEPALQVNRYTREPQKLTGSLYTNPVSI